MPSFARKFAPQYSQAAIELKKKGIPVAKVNAGCTTNAPLVERYGVEQYPALFVFKRVYDTYEGPASRVVERIEPRAADVLVKHVRLIASSPVRMRTKEDVERMVAQTVEHSNERVSALVVGVFADKKSKAFKAFALAAAGRAFNFAWVKGDDRAIVEQYCGGVHTTDTIFVVNAYDYPAGPLKTLPSVDVQWGQVEEIVTFVEIHTSPLVWKYNSAYTFQIVPGKLRKLLWAFVDKRTKHWVAYEKALEMAAISERRSFKVVLVSQDSKDALARFQVDQASLPYAIIEENAPDGSERRFVLGARDGNLGAIDVAAARDMTTPKLIKFVEDYKGGKLQPVGSDWEVQGDENKNEVSSVDKHDEL